MFPTIQDKITLYNRYAKDYEQRTSGFKQFITTDYQIFMDNLPGKRILDIGAGPGRDCEVFKHSGFMPVALDISDEMLALCRAKGIATLRMDIENLDLPGNSYDGIWSYTAFTTIPKFRVWAIVDSLAKILVPGGCLFLGLIEGRLQGWKPADQKYQFKRYTSRYISHEVITKLSRRYQLLYFRRLDKTENGRNTYLNFLWQRK
ncbi:MAG TPA: class I SAM-dependent methyltransferase [Candidatus Saccharimonadales bacterium]|jgi:SAM-dependent methyltransferase|nr:class I SAM-dependent methyltransferase [Candidatus Saccharimonadales bacterium]